MNIVSLHCYVSSTVRCFDEFRNFHYLEKNMDIFLKKKYEIFHSNRINNEQIASKKYLEDSKKR